MKKNRFWLILLGIIFVLAFLFLLGGSVKNSQTTDEAIHLFAGYSYLTRGDFRLDPEHPPFLKEVGALPILFFKNVQTPIDGLWDKAGNFYYDSWKETRTMSESFLYLLNYNADKLLFWGRFPFIVLTLLLGWMTYFWANRLYGPKAGVFGAFLILLMPNILAHGNLINTDLGLTLFLFIGTYFWGKFLKKPTWRDVVLSSLFFGLAFASKFTSVMILPIILVLVIIKLFLDSDFRNWRWYFAGILGVLLIGFLVVWATYGFSVKGPPLPIGSFSQNIKMWADYNIPTFLDGVFDRVRPLLFPADFYKGFILVLRHALGGHGAYLFGQTSSTGWWYYFPVAIFYKTPLPLFIFLALAIIYFKKIKAKIFFEELLLIIPPVVYLLLSMNSKADLGIRHVLPIFPFLVVFVAKSINLVSISDLKWSWQLLGRGGFVILILWYFQSSFSAYPNYLSYFNEVAGTANERYKILNDSNLDWGQDLYRIRDYVYSHPNKKMSMTYPWDGETALVYYGIDLPLVRPEDTNVSGDVIISATYATTEAYSWLWQYSYENITPGVLVFHVSAQG